MIIDHEGHLWGSGENLNGQLGVGDFINKNIFTMVKNKIGLQVSGGYGYTMIIDNLYHIRGSGDNRECQLGKKDETNRNVFTLQDKLKHKELSPIADDNMFIKAKRIACGDSSTIVIDEQNRIWVVGANGSGQLGLGHKRKTTTFTMVPNLKAQDVACGLLHSVIIDEEGYVRSTGYNPYGQLGVGDTNNRHEFTTTGVKASAIACSDNFTIIKQ
jgi:alpha-tubulin suppressor-like RCC1 family protein